jgi:hypothetical protein
MGKKGIIIAVSVLLFSGVALGIIAINRSKDSNDNNDIDSKEPVQPKANTTTSAPVEILKINDTIAPKGSSVNIRKSAAVVDGISNNLLKVGHMGAIGKISLYEQGKDGYIWYQVTLTPQLFVETRSHYGYVRSDVVKKV